MSDTTTPTVPTPEEIDAARAVFAAAGIPLNPPPAADDLDDADDDVLDRVREWRDEYPEILRDTVRGQVLALLSAETREGVRCATNALHDALDKTAPEQPAEESMGDRITAFLGTEAGQALTGMALKYMMPQAPEAPTPNLIVKGPKGTCLILTVGDKQIAYRIIGAAGVIQASVPKFAMQVYIDHNPGPHDADTSAVAVLDFTEESHEIDAVAFVETYRRPKPADAAPAPKAEEVQ